MKHINEYLLSKSKNKTFDDFKQFKTKEEVCDFFNSKGFEKNEYDGIYDDMMSKFSNSENPIYCVGKFDSFYHNWWVRFGNGGKQEYIFFWNIKDPRGISNYLVSDSDNKLFMKFENFEEFKNYVIKYFNW